MISPDDYDARDALGLGELVASGEATAEEVVGACLARIEALNPRINAVVHLDAEAGLARHRADPGRGPFRGVPYLVKDLHAPVAGLPLANGSRLFRGVVFDFDSEVVARLRRAGFVVVGRTNSPEFGLSASTEPRLHGPTRNPWDPSRTAGGSSGGAGAAVASGMLPAAHATDSAGSIRIPASCNGLVGLKPTRALLPYGPHRGDAAHGISHEHAVTRTLRDCAAILDATMGPDVGAPYATPAPVPSFLAEVGRDPGRLRVGLLTATFRGEPVDPVCRAAVEAAGRTLEAMGHEVEERAPAFDFDALVDAMMTVLMTGLAAQVDAREAQLGRPAGPDDLEPLSHAAVARGRSVSGTRYAACFPVLNREVRRIGAFFGGVDVLVCPTMVGPPLPLGSMSTDTGDLDAFLARLFGYIPFCAPFNATGQPAISLPLHATGDGLPVGVQLVAPFGRDDVLIRLAARLEEAMPWAGRRAPVRGAAPAR